ncbi:MAG: SAM-dependent methyltransferase [Defluviitaleaceae bacterium]|nr:SAM-dependent methyltransferase [Defluviitaleaceae bacterium]
MPKKRAESRTRYFVRSVSVKRGWNVSHVQRGGDFLEEQEIVDYFPQIGLGLDRPDFLVCLNSEPIMLIEAKNEFKKIDEAIAEAIEYANTINSKSKYTVKIAVGVAGEDDNGYQVEVRFLKDDSWQPLKSHGYELTALPSPKEIELALLADDATTSISHPSIAEYIDSAIELSSILRASKIEAPLRPKVLGAIITALYQGSIDLNEENALNSINELVSAAITQSIDLDANKKARLKDALFLTINDYERLAPKIGRVVSILGRLNIRSVLQTDTDFLGLLYEAFLRYGYDNNALGIVFTPRHITKLCVDLINVRAEDRVIDIASGTGGFLVAAFDKMMSQAKGSKAIKKVKQSLYGFDTNPTVWALASLNMFFRGDGKSHIENGDCFDPSNKASVEGKFTRAFLNPPFSQEGEPERDFIDAAMEALEPGGLFACVVKAGIFADDDNRLWRKSFIKEHSLIGVISLPEDLFYPTAAPTSILIAKAHIPLEEDSKVFMSRIWNDGYKKQKGKRVDCEGSQIGEVLRCFAAFQNEKSFRSKIATTTSAKNLMNGQEFSPQQWLKQPSVSTDEMDAAMKGVLMSIFQTVTTQPELADEVIEDFPDSLAKLPKLPYGKTKPIEYFFDVKNGKSSGEKNYTVGNCPYISSGDSFNSYIRMVSAESREEFSDGAITVTAFGQAYVQPWRFMARGNGGSAVRVLVPKFSMTFSELLWFAAQINMQKWRFFYGRMAIKVRLSKLTITAPKARIKDSALSINQKILRLKENIDSLGKI